MGIRATFFCTLLSVLLYLFPGAFYLVPQVPSERTELVPVSIEMGFELHHAEKAYIMLNMYVPHTKKSSLPRVQQRCFRNEIKKKSTIGIRNPQRLWL